MTSTIDIYLNFACIDRFLFRVSDLGEQDHLSGELAERLEACHIYLLCKRPRLGIVPRSLRVTGELLCFSVSWSLNGVVQTCDTALPRAALPTGAFGFHISDYPHREIIARTEDGALAGSFLLANHAHVLPNIPSQARALDILNVGKGLSKSAKDRLVVHGTMQCFLAELNSRDPDQELFALLYAFDRMKKNLLTVTPPEPSTEGLRIRMEQAAPFRPSKSEQ